MDNNIFLLAFIKNIPTKMKRNFSSIILWDVGANNTKIRLLIVSCCFVMFFCGLSYRLIIVATNGYIKTEYQVKNSDFRKEIVDRNGNLLAVNLPSSSLFVNPQKVINPSQCLERLSKILPEIDKMKLLAELQSNKSFVWIKRDLLPKEQEAISNLGRPGFSFEQEQKRIYTFSNLLSHIIGWSCWIRKNLR